ncbi:MAG TPA: right-handed parallel beta-helix repeat-containing protein [Bacteroidales bacterium]|nr:right-handed parallel beta-helix repeat-containing protein [Bacteroidales bacterium]
MKTSIIGSKRIFLIMVFAFMLILPTSASTALSGWINKDTVLNLAGSPYFVTNYVGISYGYTMTIEPGVVMMFNGGANLLTYGNLNADQATFKSSSSTPAPGSWGSIQIGASSDTSNVYLKNCNLEYGNSIVVHQKGKLRMENTNMYRFGTTFVQVDNSSRGAYIVGGTMTSTSTSVNSNPYGINSDDNATVVLDGVSMQYFQIAVCANYNTNLTVRNLVMHDNRYPFSFNNKVNLVVEGNNDITGNLFNGVHLNFGSLNTNWTLPKINIPYLFTNWFTIEPTRTLTVASGNIFKFNDGIGLEVKGALIANALVGEQISFTSMRDDNLGGDSNADGTASAPGYRNWYGVRFHDTSMDSVSVMRRCLVRYAGQSDIGGISLYNANPTLDNCELTNNYFGIMMQGTSSPLLTNTTIGSSMLTPLAMSFEANPVMDGNTLSFSDNDYDAIGILGGTMTANARLKIRSFTGVNNLTYLLLGEIVVPAGKTLTIDKGITIKAYMWDWPSRRIIVEGNLIANATADSMINFTSARDDNVGSPGDCNKDGTITSPAIGDWQGFIFLPGSTGLLNYCRIKYGRINDYEFISCSNSERVKWAAIGLIDASPTISNCEFKDLYQGISCYRASSPTIQNVSMVNILSTPINLASPANPAISGITFTNVRWRALGLLGGNVCLDGTIRKRDVAGFTNITYVLLSDMIIQSGTTVNIDPGIVIKSHNDYWYDNYHLNSSSIYVDGSLKVNGTSAEKIVFTSLKDDNEGNPYDTNNDGNASTPSTGDWGSIKFRATSVDTANLIRYALVKYPGYTSEGGITFENAGGRVQNTLVTNSSNYGLYFNGNSDPVITDVSIRNNSKDPVAMSLTSNPQFSGIEFVSNGSQALKIIEGTLSSTARLTSRNLAGITNIGYVVDKLVIASGAKLTIEPGVVIKFRADNWYRTYIQVYGSLIAKGLPNNKIYFTSYKDDSRGGDSNNNGNTDSPTPGDWGYEYDSWDAYGGICFFNNSVVSDTVNVLRNCEISYAQIGVRVENAHATIDSCLIQLCQHYGLTSLGSANPDIRNTQFYNIGNTPVELSMFSEPTFLNCSALNVGFMGLAVVPETYSKSATIPIRSFSGHNNITYVMEAPCTINSGCTLTIPAGVSFKSTAYMPTGASGISNGSWKRANGFIVNGKLLIEGTAANPVVFTNVGDDELGSPNDLNQNGFATRPTDYTEGEWLVFNDVSDDMSRIDHAVFRYGDRGIITNSASPKLYNNQFYKLNCGIDMNGVSAPVIDSCLFNDLHPYPIQISLVSYPASTNGNLISGSTYKVLKVRNETLTQDVVLPKRDFGGKTNIPYMFQLYEIGTSATLTLKPGVICKFQDRNFWWNEKSFIINKGLIAEGGKTEDSLIVFTSIRDDFYGGDSNSDSTASAPDEYSWAGLNFSDLSLDPLCRLKNCVIRFAQRGIATTSANPSIDNCHFNRNSYGVVLYGASNPLISNCDFNENRCYGIQNVDKSFVVQAPNCWWGSNSGPLLSSVDEPNNAPEQEYMTSSVNATPWRTTGILNPLTGDVSLNGLIQAYDASLVLKKVVNTLTLNANQLQVADVSGNGDITAYDASLILEYVVGLDNYFPVNKVVNRLLTSSAPSVRLYLDDVTTDSETFTTLLHLTGATGLRAADLMLNYDPTLLKLEKVVNKLSGATMEYGLSTGKLNLALASARVLSNTDAVAELTFRNVANGTTITSLDVSQLRINETDMTPFAQPGTITLQRMATNLGEDPVRPVGMNWYSNHNGSYTLEYTLDVASTWIKAAIYNLAGQKLQSLDNLSVEAGTHAVQLNPTLATGTYMLRMQTENFNQVGKIQIVK